MYWRTEKAIEETTPPHYTCMCDAQYGKAKYSNIAFTIAARTNSTGAVVVIEWPKDTDDYFLIRKLTPRDFYRLMGVKDEDIDKIQASGISKSQQCKMAGNSIVVDVMTYIFAKMLYKRYLKI